jgi:hypothetical protein
LQEAGWPVNPAPERVALRERYARFARRKLRIFPRSRHQYAIGGGVIGARRETLRKRA